jgi:translation initiation factor IF-1
MPKNVRGGKHSKKGKNSGPAGPGPMEYPAEDQYYGVVVKKLGNSQLDLMIAEPGSKTTCPARGVVRSRMRRMRFFEGMMVIVSLRPFEKMKPFEKTEDEAKKITADVLYVYSSEHARRLINENRVPNTMKMVTESAEEKRKAMESAKTGVSVEDKSGDAGFEFGDETDDDAEKSDEVEIDDL